MNNVTIQAAIIAAAVALIVAVINQLVSVANQILTHRLTQRRETQKYYNDVYQKLFAPIIADVFLYMDMVSNFRRGHDTSPEIEIKVKDRAIEYIGNNLLYGSPVLITAHRKISSARFKDETGFNPLPIEIFFLLEFVNEYGYVIRQSSIFSDNKQRQQMEIVEKYKILYLLCAYGFEDLLRYSSWFNEKAYSSRTYQKLHKLLKYNRDHERDHERKLSKNIGSARELLNEGTNDKSIDDQVSIANIVEEKYKEMSAILSRHYKDMIKKMLYLLIKDKKDKIRISRELQLD